MTSRKRNTHLLMLLLIAIWTAEAIIVSKAVEELNSFFLLGFKTLVSVPLILLYAAGRKELCLPQKKDIPLLLAATVLGDILYFYFEYTAFYYLPVGTVTILLGLMPATSYLVNCAVCKRRPQPVMLTLILLSVGGLIPIVAGDTGPGSRTGYLACGLCVIIWIIYGYVTRRLNEHYSSVAISVFEAVAASAIMLPGAIALRPATIELHQLLIYIILMGLLTSGIGYMIEVRGLIELGTTVSGIYLNFLPVLTALAGYIFLHEKMSVPQLIGAAVVIVCGFFVVKRSEQTD